MKPTPKAFASRLTLMRNQFSVFAMTPFRSLFLFRLGRLRRRWTADHGLPREGTYECCWARSDWLRGAACFARRSCLQSAQTSVVRVEHAVDTRGGSREHHYARARCILRSAVGPAAQAWRVTAQRAAQ